MQIIGELINASRKSIRSAIQEGDAATIAKIAKQQVECGADYVDVNAGVFVGQEPEYLKWLVETVQEAVDAPCAIDSPDPKAVETALAVHKGTPIINSISMEKDRHENLLPILAGTDLKVIALCVEDGAMPETKEDRLRIADRLVTDLVNHDVRIENIYIDPLVQPLGTTDTCGKEFLDAIEAIRAAFPEAHTMCGLSNISYWLPNRAFANQIFMAMAIAKGLDGAIVDPRNKRMMATIRAADTLIGHDSYCEKYLNAHRDKLFDFS
ncbi:MAG: methyltetrahydrofolate cobalamin methyltransferase [Opitutales bacterium]